MIIKDLPRVEAVEVAVVVGVIVEVLVVVVEVAVVVGVTVEVLVVVEVVVVGFA